MKENLAIILFVLFVCAWAATEITEYYARDTFTSDVSAFISEGERFTLEDGNKLEGRIKNLEEDAE